MSRVRGSFHIALVLSLALHVSLLMPWAVKAPPRFSPPLQVRLLAEPVIEKKPIPQASPAKLRSKSTLPAHPSTAMKEIARVAAPIPPLPIPETKPVSMAAPPPPTPEEWKLASTYTLKNSKRYRYNLGQLVRSMMGTAVEGPEQGLVRLRIEVAPDGKITKVEELWATSKLASKLAMNAIQSLPPLPPTPTGKPLVFEQTISFEPFETGWPPSYKLDCLPDPPTFKNPFVWDGSSPQVASREYSENVSPSSSAPPPADCVTDSTSHSIEEEERELKRQMDQWRWGR
ncbi:MAG: hypothetical protein B7Y41_16235 [Hydrogenophilales bacterium 28-61-23]|nr:MAG: hypothetical protein B7Y41_16235 [Hydrogenophilales bacterium 28-61-23]